MTQRQQVQSIPSQNLISFNIPNIEQLFPGFTLDTFALIYGTSTILPLSLLLAVRAQLPFQLGGLETNVVFVDGGNVFRLYDVSRLAQLHQLDPERVLKRIFISRAFTAYQMTSIILENLQETVRKYDSKLVVISDIAGLYLDKDVPTGEAKEVFNQLTKYLLKFSKENKTLVLATYPQHRCTKRNTFLHAVASGRANVVIFIRKSKFGEQFVLTKHPLLNLGFVDFPSENLTLDQFME